MKTKKWIPEIDQWYYHIDINSGEPEVRMSKYMMHTNDDKRIISGNCYKTNTEAMKKLKRIMAILKQP